MVRQSIMVAGTCGRGTSSSYGGQKAERNDHWQGISLTYLVILSQVSAISQNSVPAGDQAFKT
jgi:hypothetical protein